jgi:hypothetical protein
MIRGVDVRPRVGNRLDLLDGPAFAARVHQVGGRHAEELLHLRQPLAVVANVLNLRGQRFAGRKVFERHAQVDQSKARQLHGGSLR